MCSDGIHLIYRTRTDSDRKFYVLFVRHLIVHPCWFSLYGVESSSDGIHRFHQPRADSDGKVYVLFVRYLKKLHSCWVSLWRGESSSDGIHRIHWKRTYSDGKVYVLFVRDFKKLNHIGLAYGGQKGVPMESIGSIGDESIPIEKSMFYSADTQENITHVGLGGRKSSRQKSSDSFETNRFRWKSA